MRNKFWWQSFQTSKEVYELRNFTNTNRKKLPKMQFFKVAFFVESVAQKVTILLSPTLPPPYFSSPFFKTFVTHPPNINELDTVVTPTPVLRPWYPLKIWNVHQQGGLAKQWNPGCSTVNIGIKCTPDSDCAPKTIVTKFQLSGTSGAFSI